jgi:hypothetical protein
MPRPPHSPWFDLPNDICHWVQIMKLPIVQLSPFPFTSSLLGPNISSAPCSQTPSVYALPLISETKFHTHTKQLAELWFLYFNLYVPRQQVGRQKTVNRMVW